MIDVLIPTRDRPDFLAVTLGSLHLQDHPCWNVIIHDDGDTPLMHSTVAAKAVDLLTTRRQVIIQRDSCAPAGADHARHRLLQTSLQFESPYALMLDDDIFLESGCISQLFNTLEAMKTAPWASGCVPDLDNNKEWPSFSRELSLEVSDPWVAHAGHLPAERSLRKTQDALTLWRKSSLCAVGGYSDWDKMPRRGYSFLVRLRAADKFGPGYFVPACMGWHLDSNHGIRDTRFQDWEFAESLFREEKK